MRDSLLCPYIFISLPDSKNLVYPHSSRITLSPPFLFSTFGPVFYPLWCLRRTWLQNKAGSGRPQIQLRAPSPIPPPFIYGNSTDYRLEDKLLASTYKGGWGNDLFLASYTRFCSSRIRTAQVLDFQ